VCDLETSRMGAPYICDISRLRVKSAEIVLLNVGCFLSLVASICFSTNLFYILTVGVESYSRT